MTSATFVLSTGRCGTQWIAKALVAGFGSRVHVEHEPLHDRYDSRRALTPNATLPAAVESHLDRVAAIIEHRPYVECGFPSWSSIPTIIERLSPRVQVVHLTRHPVPTSYSWLTHGAYVPPLASHLDERVLLSPFDSGVGLPGYRGRWAELGPLEKCFYYWTEVNVLGMSVHESHPVPSLHVRFEDLFAGGFARLVEFVGLPGLPGLAVPQPRLDVVDEFSFLSPVWQDWRVIESHPAVVDTATQLGYDFIGLDDAALRRRYLGAS